MRLTIIHGYVLVPCLFPQARAAPTPLGSVQWHFAVFVVSLATAAIACGVEHL